MIQQRVGFPRDPVQGFPGIYPVAQRLFVCLIRGALGLPQRRRVRHLAQRLGEILLHGGQASLLPRKDRLPALVQGGKASPMLSAMAPHPFVVFAAEGLAGLRVPLVRGLHIMEPVLAPSRCARALWRYWSRAGRAAQEQGRPGEPVPKARAVSHGPWRISR